MDVSELTGPGFWSGQRPVVLAPPRLGGEAERWERALVGEPWAAGGVVFASSGSSGRPKWILLKKAALQASARMVNAHLDVQAGDVWMLALPLWHVGGFGVVARAHDAGCGLVLSADEWDPRVFAEQVEREGVTCSSLVPTQVHDLVAAGLVAPSSLRVAVVGGGSLPVETGRKARDLGWPVLQSYGMTETASQVATGSLDGLAADFGADGMPVLQGWEVETNSAGCLRVRGEALFEGYVEMDGGEVRLQAVGDDGWFTTTDLVRLEEGRLSFEGRADRVVKVLGELVDVGAMEKTLGELVGSRGSVALVVVEDDRAGARVVPVGAGVDLDWELVVAEFNRSQPGFARLAAPVVVSELPRTALGKPDSQALRALVEES